MNLGTAIDRVSREGGFDTTSTNTPRETLNSWITTQVNEALARSRWRKQALDIGPGVEGKSEYAIPAPVVDLRNLYVDGSPYAIASWQDVLSFQSGFGRIRGRAAGAAAASFESDTDAMILLHPAPSAGVSIIAHVAVTIGELTDETVEIPLPSDLHQRIVIDGAIGLGLQRLEESAQDAAPYLQRYEEGVAMLSKRANSRIGSGPTWIRVQRP